MSIAYNFKYPNLDKDLKFKNKILKISDKNLINNLQLTKLNYTWEYCYNNFSFYKNIKSKYKLPDFIDTLEHLNDFPIINKNILKKNIISIKNDSNTKKFSLTGGTSGILLSFPTNYYDEYLNILRTIYYRTIVHNININDPSLYIWGHSHKFGQGLKKIKNNIKANLKDFFLNRKRVSAYELDNKNIEKIIYILKKKRISYLITYGSSLEVLIDFLSLSKTYINQPIKVIITSDNLSHDHLKKFNNLFINSSLINEYGMAETGVIGYSDTNFKKINIFYDDYLLQEYKKKVLLTSLNLTCFPLIRYDPEDFISKNHKFPIEIIEELKGKQRMILNFKLNNKKISSILIDHILKNISEVIDFQYSVRDDYFYIFYQSKKDLEHIVKQKIQDVLDINISDKIKIIRKDRLLKTIAGKRKRIV